jgi:Spy/CpxP family protein refolding chaperone
MKGINMKNQLKILVLAAVIGISSITYADMQDNAGKNHEKRTPEQRVEKRLERMKKNLNISDAQATQIRTVLMNKKNEMQDRVAKMKSAPAADKAALRSELKSARLSTHNEILSILTPEQRTKAESMREAMKGKMKGKHKGKRSHDKS